MSHENVEMVRRVYEAAARRDAGAVLACYDAGVEWDVSRSPMAQLVGGGVYQGHEGLLTFFRKYHEAWEDVGTKGAELSDAGGGHVICVDTQRTRGRASGVETELTQYAVWTVREGKIVRVVVVPLPAPKPSKPPG